MHTLHLHWFCSQDSFESSAHSYYACVIFEGKDHSLPREHSEIAEGYLYLGLPFSHLYFHATLERTSAILETLCSCGLITLHTLHISILYTTHNHFYHGGLLSH